MVQQSCHTCRYDNEMDGQRLCILRRSIVMEFAKDHFLPGNFEILNNWFMGHETCGYWVAKESFRSAYVRAMRVAHIRNLSVKPDADKEVSG